MSGEELRAIRLSLGMSQREFGRCVGYSQVHIYRLERGRHPIKARVADALLLISVETAEHQRSVKRTIDWLVAG